MWLSLYIFSHNYYSTRWGKYMAIRGWLITMRLICKKIWLRNSRTTYIHVILWIVGYARFFFSHHHKKHAGHVQKYIRSEEIFFQYYINSSSNSGSAIPYTIPCIPTTKSFLQIILPPSVDLEEGLWLWLWCIFIHIIFYFFYHVLYSCSS